jgi:hypothetical protein
VRKVDDIGKPFSRGVAKGLGLSPAHRLMVDLTLAPYWDP